MNPNKLVSLRPIRNKGDFFDVSGIASDTVQLLLLEHEERIEDSVLESLFPWTAEDLVRISAFTHQAAKTSWCFSRFLARKALASALGFEPSALAFGYGPFGKPYLEGGAIRFNWSHAPGCVILALSRDTDVGCDIEDTLQSSSSYRDVARAYFSIAEREWMQSPSSPVSSWERFLTLFVEKEARLKAAGLGLYAKLYGNGGAMRDPPFREGDLTCFRHGAGGRYMIALYAASGAPGDIGLSAHLFGTGGLAPGRDA